MPLTKINLDPVTTWRAQQIARQENRSLPQAIERLVSEAWNARQEAHTATLMPVLAEERLPAAGTVSAHLPAERLAAVRRIADADQRNISQTINVLLAEAIAARATRSA